MKKLLKNINQETVYFCGFNWDDGNKILDLKTASSSYNVVVKQFYNHLAVMRLIDWNGNLTTTKQMVDTLNNSSFYLTFFTKKDVPNIDKIVKTKFS